MKRRMKRRKIKHLPEHKQRIITVGRTIGKEANKPRPKYNQETWGNINFEKHRCSTPACVAGWTVAMYGTPEGLRRNYNSISGYAAELLGLDHKEEQNLFYAHWPERYLRKIEHERDLGGLMAFIPKPEEAAQILELIGFGELEIVEKKE